MSCAFQTEAITDAVNGIMKTYLAAVDAQLVGASVGERRAVFAGVVQAAATIHAAALQSLAMVEAAEIQAAALDRLAIAIRSKRGD